MLAEKCDSPARERRSAAPSALQYESPFARQRTRINAGNMLAASTFTARVMADTDYRK